VPADFRKLDAVAVLTARLLPAPRESAWWGYRPREGTGGRGQGEPRRRIPRACPGRLLWRDLGSPLPRRSLVPAFGGLALGQLALCLAAVEPGI